MSKQSKSRPSVQKNPVLESESDHPVEGLGAKELQNIINRLNKAEINYEEALVREEMANKKCNGVVSVLDQLKKSYDRLEEELKLSKERKSIKNMIDLNVNENEIKRIREIFRNVKAKEADDFVDEIRTQYLPKNLI